MKYLFVLLTLFLGLSSCENKTELSKKDINSVILNHFLFDEYCIDTILLYPTGMHSFKDYLVVIEPKNNPTLSFWNLSDLGYRFSSGFKGGGPNELIIPRRDYFAKSDSSFFILDSNIERELAIDNKHIRMLNNKPIEIPDAINQMVKVGNDYYITAGFTTGEGEEHLIYTEGGYTGFGEYPKSELRETAIFMFNYKFTAGVIGKDIILDFYTYRNLIRKYTIAGELLEEISLDGIEKRDNNREKISNGTIKPYFTSVFSTNKFIYVLFNDGASEKELRDCTILSELQVWSWDGDLVKRIKFNMPFNLYTVSDENKLYAMNSFSPDKIYVYDFNK